MVIEFPYQPPYPMGGTDPDPVGRDELETKEIVIGMTRIQLENDTIHIGAAGEHTQEQQLLVEMPASS